MEAFSIWLPPHNALLSLLWQARGPAALCHESHSQVVRLWSEAPVALGLIWTSRGLVGERGQRRRLSTYVASDWLCGEWKWPFNRFYRFKSAGFQIKTAITQKAQHKRTKLHRFLSVHVQFNLPEFIATAWVDGPRALRERWKEHYRRSKQGKPKRRKEMSAIWLEGLIFNHKKNPLATSSIFLFCPRSWLAIFFGPPISVTRLGRGNTNSHSKINTAILCVFTFHSAVSICESVPQNVLFHFMPWGRACFLAHCTDEKAR